jgi:hypothetical protein
MFEDEKRAANAAFIVTACNAHDELVAALQLIQLNAATALEYSLKEQNGAKALARLANIHEWPGMVAARAALAKVTP